jgi:hypothetical protein
VKTVSAAYKDMQKSNEIRPVRKVELFRRLADGSGWEASPTDITGEIIRLDRLSWKLDTDDLNEFKASNIRFEVNNETRLWDENSTRFSGFLRYRSRVRIQLGLKPGTTEEIFPAFTGVIEDALEDSQAPTLSITLESLDAFLRTQTAEGAGILVVNELLGVGNGVQSDFLTSQNAVGIIKEVRVAGVRSRPGKHWSVSQLNEAGKPAKITFVASQPASGEEVRADYIRWKTNQQIHSVAQDLMALVPQVPVAQIEPVTFIDPTFSAEVLHTLQSDFNAYELRQARVETEPAPPSGDGAIALDPFDSQTKWQTGVLSGMNLTRVPDSLIVHWPIRYEGDVLPNQEPGWSESETTTVNKSVNNGILSLAIPGTGSWIYSNINHGSSLKRSLYWRMKLSQINGQFEVSSFFLGSGRGAKAVFINFSQIQITGASTVTVIQDSTAPHDYRLEMDDTTGTWRFLVDGSERASGAMGAASGSVDGLLAKAFSVSGLQAEIDYLRLHDDTSAPVGTWENVIDYGFHLPNIITFGLINTLGSFFAEVLGNAADVLFHYAFSNDGTIFDPEQTVGNGGNLGSFSNVTSRRYLKFRIEVRGSGAANFASVRRLLLPGLAASTVIDPGTSPIFWESWKASFDTNGGSIRRFTGHAAPSASGFSYYQSVGPGDEIISDEFARGQGALADELVMVILLNPANATSPIFRESLVSYSTNVVLLSVANVSVRNIIDVLKELAQIADFEIGVDGDGKFFFRNKASPITAVVTLDDTNVLEVRSFSPGWERVYNRIRASFGSFAAEADSLTEGEASPTSMDRFRTRVLSVGGGSLLFQSDVDLATGMAKRYWRRYKEPKRRATVIVRFMPELELGDRASLNIALPRRIGQAFDARILGIAHDLMGFKTELDLQEV